MSRKKGDLSMLSHMPFKPQWLQDLAAFQSSNPRIVRAGLNMLIAAFYNERCGEVDSSLEALATATHLSIEEVEENLPVLTRGWKKVRRGRAYCFEPLAELAKRFDDGFGQALQSLQDRAVAAICSPDLAAQELFDVQGEALANELSGETVRKAQAIPATKVPRRLPEGAQMSERMKKVATEKGFTKPQEHEQIWELFYHYYFSQGLTSHSWESEFVRWLNNQLRYGRLTPDADVPSIYPTGANSQKRTKRDVPPPPAMSTRAGAVNFKSIQSEELAYNTKEKMRQARELLQSFGSEQRPAPKTVNTPSNLPPPPTVTADK